jgi:glycosyltransferase involved in cell wall biosynthesis
LKIAIDASELHGKPTGVGRYLSKLLDTWKELPAAAGHEFVLFAPAPEEHAGTAWQQLTLPRLIRGAQADVFFAPGYSAPLRCPVPMVVAVHDVSFCAHPEWFGWREGLRRRTLARWSARRAARVLTISEFSKQEIVRHLGVPPGKIEVTYLGVGLGSDPIHDSTQGVESDHIRGLTPVLFVGSIFNRRHVPELIEGFARLARKHDAPRLELVGDNRTMPHVHIDTIVARTGLADRIRIRSYVDDATLATLYRRAGAFAFLSEYEGFGLTPLEALAASVPLVVLDTAVAREIYGAAAIYVARPDPALIETALERALFDRPERTRMLQAATEVLQRYSWEACAARTLEILVGSARPVVR